LLERELADVAVCDPHALTPTQPLTEAVSDADAVIVATNHSEFESPETMRTVLSCASPDCLLVDPWNSFGTTQVFMFANEATAMAALAEAGREAVGGAEASGADGST
jgi:UDP-N-acetyl-D-mannosaminuronic acid dehydrogenase